jgi:hypothetical protein
MRHITNMLAIYLILFLTMCICLGCASTPANISLTDDTQKYDKKLNFNSAQGEEVLVRGKDIVFQHRQFLETRLHHLESVASDLQDATYGRTQQEPTGLWLQLRDCTVRLSDARIGWAGGIIPQEKWENVMDRDGDYKYVVDKHDSIIAVSEEQVDARLTRFLKHVQVLSERYTELSTKLTSCETKYRAALISKGIDPESAKSQGEWVDRGKGYLEWHLTRSSTNNPSEMMKRSAQ